MAIGLQSGRCGVLNISYNTVHGLFRDLYAYRDSMTDVVVQNLITEEKVRCGRVLLIGW